MIERLITGYRCFRSGYYEENSERLIELAQQGQSPKAAVIACCDSRLDPAVITQSAPGELFVIRNVANLVPPYESEGVCHGTSAALQFAVCDLQVEHIIVLGHSQCGGIKALLTQPKPDDANKDFIASWISIADEASQRILHRNDLQSFEEQCHACELESIEASLLNLQTFPWIAKEVKCGRLQLHGWHYDLEAGSLLSIDPATGIFHPN